MTASAHRHNTDHAIAPLLEARGIAVNTLEGRPLFANLHISLTTEPVALVGRNGVGKSTLLSILAGNRAPDRGTLDCKVDSVLVPQDLDEAHATAVVESWRGEAAASPRFARRLHRDLFEAGLPPLEELASGHSRGQLRKLHLLAAKRSAADLLLLDEPSQDLDAKGAAWLRGWLGDWSGGLVVVSHDRELLRLFEHFVVIAESGCRYIPGSFAHLEKQLREEEAQRQRQYIRNLNTLANEERKNETICRRRLRKKNVGRLHELRRRTSRARLNEKRSYAQQSQARVAKIREDRISATRQWAKATRRALAVSLPLSTVARALPPDDGTAAIELDSVGITRDGRELLSELSLKIGRDRLAIAGDNGAGKTTLLQVMTGQRSPSRGRAQCHAQRLGVIAQGSANWDLGASIVEHLGFHSALPSLDAVAQLLLAHRFPLALAQRPMASLSPGERVRAALVCITAQEPAVDVLVVDEPTFGLDFVGYRRLGDALRAWRGGLVIVSHDREFLDEIGIDRHLMLDGHGGHRYL